MSNNIFSCLCRAVNELNQENISIIMQGCEKLKLKREQNQAKKDDQYPNIRYPPFMLHLSSQQS